MFAKLKTRKKLSQKKRNRNGFVFDDDIGNGKVEFGLALEVHATQGPKRVTKTLDILVP